LKLRAIFTRRPATIYHLDYPNRGMNSTATIAGRSATSRLRVKTYAGFAAFVRQLHRRQPDDFAQRRLRFEFHEAFHFFTLGLRRGRRLTNSLSDVFCPT
jgi:hypothetical protein